MSFIHDAQIREEDLQAYVDGLLDVNLRAAVEAYLALHPSEAERVTAYRAQNVALHQAYDCMIKAPLPTAVERMAEKLSSGSRSSVVWRALQCAAVIGGFAVAGTMGWVAHDQWASVQEDDEPFSGFTRRAIEAHAMLTGSQSPPLVEKGVEGGNALVSWLAQRTLSTPRSAPDLTTFGMSLAGGRIFFIREQLVVQLIYENDKSRLSLYVGAIPPDNERTSFTFAQQGDLSTFYWRQGKLEFSLVGRMEREKLLDVAQVVHAHLGMTAPDEDKGHKDVRPAASPRKASPSRPEVAPRGPAPDAETEKPPVMEGKPPVIGPVRQEISTGRI